MASCLDTVRTGISGIFLFGNHRPPRFGCCSHCFPHKIFREKEVLVCHVDITIRITRSLTTTGQDTARGEENAAIPAL